LARSVKVSITGHQAGSIMEILPRGTGEKMNNSTNESNESYERRMAIKELMSAPQGTQFEKCLIVNGKELWFPTNDPKWNFEHYTYRIAPQPKKVLRPVGEVLDEANRRKQLTVVQNVVSIIEGGQLWYIADLLTQVVVEQNAPEWFFTTEEAK
jgi:hypothetical protein